ncbi:MAG: hypothetical protein ACOYO9_09160, partial [Candidatus Nanopelagicales bacterium]
MVPLGENWQRPRTLRRRLVRYRASTGQAAHRAGSAPGRQRTGQAAAAAIATALFELFARFVWLASGRGADGWGVVV